ncbi:MAG: hypothetical protein J6K81_07695 [Rikenellaceae bacterium]|nr:hypothetical protein [Rikenellaceae bacterium]
MKRLFNILLCAVAMVALGACNDKDDDNGGGKKQTIEQKLQGKWIATRQVVTIKMNGQVIDEVDDVLGIGDGLGFAFTEGKQLFALVFEEVDGKAAIESHVYVGQWKLDGKKLTVDYIDDGASEDIDLFSMGAVTVESVNDTQLVLKMSMVEEMDGQKAEVTALCYFARSNVDFNVGSLID